VERGDRRGRRPPSRVAVDEQLPQLVAAVALGAAMATYRHWIRHPEADLVAELDRAFSLLAAGFPGSPP
jgi:hypothetical protein